MDIYLSKNLKFLRKEQRLSQSSVARDLGISRNKIVSYENRNIQPKITLLIRLSKYFKIPLYDLVTTEIDSENYRILRHNYITENEYPSVHSKKKISLGAIEDFIIENERITKIYEGIEVLISFKENTERIDQNTKDLLMVLERTLNMNKNFIESVSEINLRQNEGDYK